MNAGELKILAVSCKEAAEAAGPPGSPWVAIVGGMLENLPIAVYLCDREGLITFYSKHAAKVWGRLPKLHDPEDRYCGSFRLYTMEGHPLPLDRCWMAETLRTGEERIGRGIIVERPDGRRISCQAYASPLRNRSGELVGALNVLIEASPECASEQPLLGIPEAISPATGQEFLQSLVDHLSRDCGVDYAFIGRMDPSDSTRITTIAVSHKGSRAENFTYRLEGSPCCEVVDRELCFFPTGVQDLFPRHKPLSAMGIESYMGVPLFSTTEAPPGLLALLHTAAFENPKRTEDSLRAVAARAGAELDRETAVRALRESEARLSALVSNSPGISMQWFDAEGRVVLWNHASEDLFGYTAEEAMGKTLGQLIFTAEQDAAFLEICRRVARNGKTVGPDEYHFHNKLGLPGVCLSTVFRIPGVKGGDYFVCMDVDITERKRSEDALRESEARLLELTRCLEERVSERTRELEEKTRRLRWLAAELTSVEQRERKRMAAILHDDLQQLLVASRMQMRQAGDRISEGAAGNAVSKSRDLLDLAIARARDLTMQLRPPALYEDGLIAALGWLADTMLERHGVRVVIDAPKAEPAMDDDLKAFLFECVRELLFNAAKHAGVDELRVEAGHGAGRFHLAVLDRGAGFDPAAAAKQAGGYGLFSIRERITALGGSMSIDSSPGNGTRIELNLALAPAAAAIRGAAVAPPAVSAAAAIAEESPEHRIRVLVVDDHAIVREGITNVLGADERLVVVGEAADGLEAIEAVERRRPDVALMDVNMPRMNGVEAAREIRRRWPEIVVIGLSIQDDEATSQSMMNAGAKAFTTKAGDSEQLIELIVSLARGDAEK